MLFIVAWYYNQAACSKSGSARNEGFVETYRPIYIAFNQHQRKQPGVHA